MTKITQLESELREYDMRIKETEIRKTDAILEGVPILDIEDEINKLKHDRGNVLRELLALKPPSKEG